MDHHTDSDHRASRVVVTGATGYVGSRLIPVLLERGHEVTAVSRRLSSLRRFDWFDRVTAQEGDVSDPTSLEVPFRGADVVYYLVHSMGDGDSDFEDAESRAATSVADAAASAGVRQIIYLSGLHPRVDIDGLSPHMRSRERVAQILTDSPVPTLVLRAATLIGAGSASFEMIRHLSGRLPVMLGPVWLNNEVEPLAVNDAVHYLVEAAELDEPVNEGFDVGCGHRYRFADLLRICGRAQGHRRRIGALPVATPLDPLAGYLIALVTPVPASLTVPLSRSLAEDAVTADHGIARVIPDPPGGFTDYPDAVEAALSSTSGEVPTSFDHSWAQYDASAAELPTDPDWVGRDVYSDERTKTTTADVDALWRVIEGIGGDTGWYSTPLLWRVRGLLDRIAGGPGLGGRRDPDRLREGDRLDWWRVVRIDRPHTLVLLAEMKLSGRAWLILDAVEGETEGESDGGGAGNHGSGRSPVTYRQRAILETGSLAGRAYWWTLKPFHAVIFPTMARNITEAAEGRSRR